ncbi:MAG: HNH endonuclease [Thermodesulfobacteriota bacterium]
MHVPEEEEIKKEKAKARQLRASQWWKRRLAKGVCYYCGRAVSPKKLTMDHIVPIARGGKSNKGNVVACCKDCNTRKQSMLPMEWAEYINRLRSDQE